MVRIATTITFAATLIGFAIGKDYSRHNCCLNHNGKGWTYDRDLTYDVCGEETYLTRANFNGIVCLEKPGHAISGDEFYDACRSKGWEKGYTDGWQVGAGYRGTC